ncbi:hypothetical protein H2789_03885 [Acinetobacter calcoaceticus]
MQTIHFQCWQTVHTHHYVTATVARAMQVQDPAVGDGGIATAPKSTSRLIQ